MGRRPLSPDDAAVYREVGWRIRAARHARSMTQDALARLVGLSRGSVANIEAGAQGISLPLFLSLADALDTDWADLLRNGTGTP